MIDLHSFFRVTGVEPKFGFGSRYPNYTLLTKKIKDILSMKARSVF